VSAPLGGLALDVRTLETLRQQSKNAPTGALRDAAQQFEALFMSMVLKSMRDALPQADPLASEPTRMYTSMLDQQLAQALSGKGVGLADMLVKQLERSSGGATAAQRVPNATAAPAPETQGEFVRRMAPHADAVQREHGIPAHFVLGQAALESGWGRREIRAADGTPSHNLFGIKAGPGWKGATVETQTLEYVNGVPRKVTERFRAYDSYADAFRDYGSLIAGSPRYADAARAAHDAAEFARGVQSGGYATDPAYAEKLAQTIDRARAIQSSAPDVA
jgi:flagellar protein FlgJ